MAYRTVRFSLIAALALVIAHAGSIAYAQIGNPFRADVQGYFGANNDAFQQSLPASLTWPGPGATLGPYPINGITSVPAPSATPQYTSPPVPTLPGLSQNFLPGHIWAPPAITLGGSTLNNASIGYSGPGLSTVADAAILPKFDFSNGSALNGYAQFRFEEDFTYNGSLAGGIGAAPSFSVTVNTTTYSQFAGQVRYYWSTISTAGLLTGTWTYLGSLDYDISTGAFSGSYIAAPLGSSSLLPAPAGGSILALVGDFYVAGDPASIEVHPTPEPSTFVLGALGLLGLGVVARRKKNRVA